MLVGRIISNLLDNAIKYTKAGGVLLAYRHRSAPTGCTTVGTALAPPYWQVDIWDTGIGIAEADFSQIFDEFHQVNTESDGAHSPGAGLGLAIVKCHVDLLGLGLTLRSQVMRGTHWSLQLPACRSEDAIGPVDVRPAPMPRVALEGLHVVLLENNPVFRETLVATLMQWGLRVRAGESREDVLPSDGSPDIVPDAVIADYWLQHGRTGVAEVRALLASWRSTPPVLIITAETAVHALEDIEQAGYPRLDKPFDPDALKAWLADACSQRGDPT